MLGNYCGGSVQELDVLGLAETWVATAPVIAGFEVLNVSRKAREGGGMVLAVRRDWAIKAV
jgi:hypothetical protein